MTYKKLLMSTLSVSILLLSGLQVVAAEGETEAVEPSAVAETTGEVNFTVDDSSAIPDEPEVIVPTDPTGPPKPIEPGDPAEGGGGNGKKSFNINWISNFKFKDIQIGPKMSKFSEPTTLHIKDGDDIPNLANFLQVTDNRGIAEGWKVTAAATPFVEVSEANNPATLKGAQLFLRDPYVVNFANPSGEAKTSNNINLLAVDKDGNPDAVRVFSATPSVGMGTWTLAWGAEDDDLTYRTGKGVELVVPVSAQPKADAQYKSNITWTLISDVPI